MATNMHLKNSRYSVSPCIVKTAIEKALTRNSKFKMAAARIIFNVANRVALNSASGVVAFCHSLMGGKCKHYTKYIYFAVHNVLNLNED